MIEKPLKWFETHAHFSDSQFDSDRDQALQRAFQQNVSPIIEIADGPAEWPKAKELVQRHPNHLYWAAGFHPYYADQASDDNFDQLKQYCSEERFVAIGEVGLDYFKCQIPKEVQKKTFRRAIELSQEVNKPLIIHCRDAYPDLLPILKEYFSSSRDLSPGVVHCFSGSLDDANEIIKAGFYLGVDGPLTYPKADELREIFRTVPSEKIVLETDTPYLPPQGFRGKRNESGYLPLIGNKLAEIKDTSVDVLSQLLFNNSQKLFRLI